MTAGKRSARRFLGGPFRARELEATSGFEPLNRGFADLRVEPLHHVASWEPPDSAIRARRRLVAPRGFEPRLTDSKSAVLPLDEGASSRAVAYRHRRARGSGQRGETDQ